MTNTVLLIFTLVIIAAVPSAAGPDRFPGEDHPPATPEPFEPQMFSSKEGRYGMNLHSSLYFAPGGDEVFFTHQSIPPRPGRSTTIMVVRRIEAFWTEPVEAPFASDFSDQTGWFSPDGTRFYFGSVRPPAGGRVPEPKLLMWYTDREETGWSIPKHVLSYAELTADHGPMYVFDDAAGGYGKNDVCRLTYENGGYSGIKNVGPPVNTPAQEYPVLVGPGEDYLVIYRTDRRNREITGLYVTFKTAGGWTEPQKMGDEVGAGFDASLSPDGKTLFFLKRRDGMYRVDAGIIGYLRDNDLNLHELLLAAADEGPGAVRDEFLRLKTKHTRYYNFDESALNTVGDKLAAAGMLEQASGVWQINFGLFPHRQSELRTLAVAALGGGPDALDRECARISRRGLSGTDVDEGGINRLGYVLLRAGRHVPAVRLFELNVSLFPLSYNVYDSYAEAMLETGDKKAALSSYKKSLEINPDNTNAADMLKKLLDE